ncbi:MAG: hypothetical protein ABIJ09_20070 [Pseudomonadota bacterium]
MTRYPKRKPTPGPGHAASRVRTRVARRPRVERIDDADAARDRVASAILAGLLHVPLGVELDLDAIDLEPGRDGELQGWLDGYCDLLELPGGAPARTLQARSRRARSAADESGPSPPVDEARVHTLLERTGRNPYLWHLRLLTRHARSFAGPALVEAALRHAMRELPDPVPRRRRVEHQLHRLWLQRDSDEEACVYLGWRGPWRGTWQVGVWNGQGQLLMTVSAHRPSRRVRGLLASSRSGPGLPAPRSHDEE